MKIYVASSWKNLVQPGVVMALRKLGHDVYDFRHPAPGNDGFRWSEVDPDYKQRWYKDPQVYIEALKASPVAEHGFLLDMNALRGAQATVLVLPCGRSAHLELGFAAGAGQRTAIFIPTPEGFEPELMYRMCDLVTTSLDELLDWAGNARAEETR